MDADLVIPRRLYPGARVGLVTTSFPVAAGVVDKSVAYLETFGWRVDVGRHARQARGFLAGTAGERTDDLMSMFLNPRIDGVFVTSGGRTASHLIDRLDYAAIQAHPKIFMGLSNPTVVVNAVAARTGLITFHGPTGYNFGETAMTPFTEASMLRALTDPTPLGRLAFTARPQILRSGRPVTGRLFGGHLLTIRGLLGTPYAPDWTGAVLMIEDCLEELHDFDDSLTHFRNAGVLERIAALLVGEPLDVHERAFPTEEDLRDVTLRLCHGYDFPILYGMAVGHTADKTVLPIGAVVTVDATSATVSVTGPVVT